MSDEDKKRLSEGITELFEKEINPMLSSHGGFVSLVNLDNFVAFVTVGAGCHDTGSFFAHFGIRQIRRFCTL
jgi:Fe-S cluster biogenesis protein NfuA